MLQMIFIITIILITINAAPLKTPENEINLTDPREEMAGSIFNLNFGNSSMVFNLNGPSGHVVGFKNVVTYNNNHNYHHHLYNNKQLMEKDNLIPVKKANDERTKNEIVNIYGSGGGENSTFEGEFKGQLRVNG